MIMKINHSFIRQFLTGFLMLSLVLSPLAIGSVPAAANGTKAPATTGATVASTAPSGAAPGNGVVYPGALSITHTAPHATLIETNRGRILYAKDAGVRLTLPAANKIMTALIAAEKLSLDTKITISNVAAAAGSGESTDDRISLKTGDKYSAEYLMTRLLYYDSDAAAVALAEQISNEEAEFVKLMNARAVTYTLNNTLFANASGESILRNTIVNERAVLNNQVLPSAQYSSVADLAALVQMALLNEKFSRLFKKQSDYIVLDGKTLVPMVNRISRLWPYSEGRVSGAYLNESSVATCVTTGTVNGINIISITAQGDRTQVVSDVLALYDACQRTYENTPLVQAGDVYTGTQETTLDGEVFGLVYQKTINYVHPIGDLYLMPTVRYNSFGPYSRPIQRSMTVGQVIFELVDGTRIAVDVTPDRQILSSISLVDRALSTLQSNRNLFYMLVITLSLLVLSLAGRAILLTIRLLRRRKPGMDDEIKTEKHTF